MCLFGVQLDFVKILMVINFHFHLIDNNSIFIG